MNRLDTNCKTSVLNQGLPNWRSGVYTARPNEAVVLIWNNHNLQSTTMTQLSLPNLACLLCGVRPQRRDSHRFYNYATLNNDVMSCSTRTRALESPKQSLKNPTATAPPSGHHVPFEGWPFIGARLPAPVHDNNDVYDRMNYHDVLFF